METQKITNEIKNQILVAISSNGGEISSLGLMRLIEATNKLNAPQFVKLHNYSSDASDNGELADYLINVGVVYENAKKSTQRSINTLTVDDMIAISELCAPESIKGFNFINLKGVDPLTYCDNVKGMLFEALDEMKTVKPKESNNIALNSVLSFNTNTGNLLIRGEMVKGGKTVTVEQIVPKMVAKAPKTVAKEIINGYLNTRASKMRTFNITNLNKITINHKEIELVEV
jgi:hypothetical protein